MKITLLLWVLSALETSAQNPSLPKSGVNTPSFVDTPEAQQVFEAAGRQPNATSGLNFSIDFNNLPEAWRWRINITDVAVPNRVYDLGSSSANFSEGLRVANTQWELQWNGDDDNFASLLGNRSLSLTWQGLVTSKPSNITNGYKGDSDVEDGSCATIFGDQCAQSLLEATSKGDSDTAISTVGLQGCENTFDVNEEDDLADGTGTTLNSNSTNGWRMGDTLMYSTSRTYNSSNPAPFEQSKRAVQILFLRFKKEGGGPVGGGATVLCRIVEKDTNAPDESSAAKRWHQSSAALWAMAILSVTLIVLQ